jgi:hypothetical protein
MAADLNGGPLFPASRAQSGTLDGIQGDWPLALVEALTMRGLFLYKIHVVQLFFSEGVGRNASAAHD